jgi:hypothetical protein
MIQPDYAWMTDGEATVLLHYTKALRALQAALDDETQRMTPETLCATELLGVYEVRLLMTLPYGLSIANSTHPGSQWESGNGIMDPARCWCSKIDRS